MQIEDKQDTLWLAKLKMKSDNNILLIKMCLKPKKMDKLINAAILPLGIYLLQIITNTLRSTCKNLFMTMFSEALLLKKVRSGHCYKVGKMLNK